MLRTFSQSFTTTSLALAALVTISLTLAGCGRRGALEAPPGAAGASASKPQGARLTPGGATSRQNLADRDPLAPTSRLGEEEDEPPVSAPNRPFILDAIL